LERSNDAKSRDIGKYLRCAGKEDEVLLQKKDLT
jgi:hypothetical protein